MLVYLCKKIYYYSPVSKIENMKKDDIELLLNKRDKCKLKNLHGLSCHI